MFREITMQDIRELLRRHEAGQSARKIAHELGVDRKTVGRYLEQAQKLETAVVTDDVALAVGQRVQARPPLPLSQAWQTLVDRRAQIEAWLTSDTPLRLVRIRCHRGATARGHAQGHSADRGSSRGRGARDCAARALRSRCRCFCDTRGRPSRPGPSRRGR